ncbi:Beta-galactosidase [subsurface metagenome]
MYHIPPGFFTCDITYALNDAGPQEIVLGVWDPTNAGYQPRGKQVKKPGGIWYTAVTGIWQTVWLEPVSEAYIKSLKIVPDIDAETVRVTAVCSEGTFGYSVEAEAKDGWFTKAKGQGKANKEIILQIKKPKLWSPDSPFLYELKVTLKNSQGKTVDAVSSYFGMRKISLGKDKKGVTRIFLNNKPLFQFGPLDQGWWPDGLYTAPTDEALRYDIEVLKKLGCNMLRKHVKVEPARLYYWCDKLGLLVWQDMPNGDKHIGGRDSDLKRSDESARQFELELKRVINAFHNHPCIVMWVPFNEGWGQYDTGRIVNFIKELDPTRLVNNTSGWADRGVGDVHDIHRYPGPAAPPTEENRAAVLGEFGGLGLPVKGHTWQDKKNWGYRSYKTREELTDAYLVLLENLRSLIGGGLCAGVYTQTTDVEIEVNGLMTYDRAMIKMDVEKTAAANRRLYLPPPVVKTIVPTSQKQGQWWRYTTSEPRIGWQRAGFDDSAWQKGRGGFGTEGTPGAVAGTEWKSSDIWLRRTFELENKKLSRPQLLIHHDEDAEVYINGRLIAKLDGYTSSYVQVRLDEKAQRALKVGSNCLAVHCTQTTGGQYIDVGLVDVIEQ